MHYFFRCSFCLSRLLFLLLFLFVKQVLHYFFGCPFPRGLDRAGPGLLDEDEAGKLLHLGRDEAPGLEHGIVRGTPHFPLFVFKNRLDLGGELSGRIDDTPDR